MRAIVGAGLLVLSFLFFVGLGAWQLDRAEQKRALFSRFDSPDPLNVTTVLDLDDASRERYHQIRLGGRFLSSKQILLDAMTHGGQAGYHVLTPFRPLKGEQSIIVNRGWIGARADRGIPDIAIAENERYIDGRLDTLPQPGLRLSVSAASVTETWPQVVLFPTINDLEAILKEPLFDYQLLLDAGESDGFVRDWQPRSMPPERHLGYALQWFGLATVAACIGIVLGVAALRRRSDQRTRANR